MTYLVAGRDRRRAILVDPAGIDAVLYGAALEYGLAISDVLMTRFESYMVHGLRTLSRIFPITVHSGGVSEQVPLPVRLIADRTTFSIGDVAIEAIPVQAHSRTSLLYLVDGVLFSGTAAHAGTLGQTQSPYAEAMLITALQDEFARLPDETVILPAIGPPTTVGAERAVSPYFSRSVPDSPRQ